MRRRPDRHRSDNGFSAAQACTGKLACSEETFKVTPRERRASRFFHGRFFIKIS